MTVKLIDYTPEPELKLTTAFSQCYQKPANIDVVRGHLQHQSVLEHVCFSFEVEVSRVCWEQLVRHRMASYTAQSHRYTDIQPEDCYCFIPSEIPENEVEEWKQDAQSIYNIYKKWRDKGVTKQTARYLAPKGVAIRALVTMNLRSLINFFSLRLDIAAQEEIRLLAADMYNLVMDKLPNLKPAIDEIILEHCTPADPSLFVGDVDA